MDTIVYGNFTVLDIIIAAAVLIGLVYGWRMLKKVLRTKDAPVYAQKVHCTQCGWEGQVSKHAGRCPKCNALVGEQRAKQYKQ